MTSQVNLFLAFSAGLLSILSPCVLALLPAYLGFLTGLGKHRIWRQSFLFIIGFSLVFIAFGASATYVGQLFLGNQILLNRIAGVVVIVFGLQLLGVLKFALPGLRTTAPQTRFPALNAVLLGMAFAAGWSPCVGPILGSILMLAGTQANVSQGILLLLGYSAGMAIPFLVVSALHKKIVLSRLQKYAAYFPVISGTVLVLLGLGMFFNIFAYLTRFAIFNI